jgi:GDP-4-dehydro-6-deoxy-D-mannose reductase
VRALVTGATGFVGPYLTEHLADAGDDVVGLDVEIDVTDAESIHRALLEIKPQVVYHLAALSHVGESWNAPGQVFEVNTMGTLNVLLASGSAGVERVLVVGSAEQYGQVEPGDMPIDEDQPMRPITPYGASKAAAEMAASHAYLGRGLPVLCARAFNHIGPGQSPGMVVSAIAEQVARNERSGDDVVLTGDLTPTRDFTDVRDVVRAYRLLVEVGEPGEVYNVCSGRAVAIREVAEKLLALADRPMRIETDPSRLRPVEVPAHWGDNTKLRTATGWLPTIPLERSMADVLAWWRDRTEVEPLAEPSS